MLNRLIDFSGQIRRSPDFQSVFDAGRPARPARIDRLRETLARFGHQLPRSLSEFYEGNNGLTFRWTCTKVSHPDYLTAGSTSISDVETLEASIRVTPDAPAVFDYVSDLSQVSLLVKGESLVLQYKDQADRVTVPLPLDIPTYLELLDQSRGLYPWQRMVVASPPVKPVLHKKFFADLSLLFGDVDPRAFGVRE